MVMMDGGAPGVGHFVGGVFVVAITTKGKGSL